MEVLTVLVIRFISELMYVVKEVTYKSYTTINQNKGCELKYRLTNEQVLELRKEVMSR